MDTKIEKKKGLSRKHIIYLSGSVLVLSAILWSLFGISGKSQKVERDSLHIVSVRRGSFHDYIRVDGRVQPFSTIQVSAIEGGVVEETLVEEGAMVKKGQVLVRLANPSLSLSILDSEAQLAEKQNFLRNTQVTMEQDKLNLRRERLQVELDIERKKRKADQYEQLYKEELCSREEYLQAKEDYDFSRRSGRLISDRQLQDSIYRGIQVDQMEESLHNMRRNLQLVRQRIDNLDIKAPADGQLGLLDVEIGQMIHAGTKVGQVHVLSNYKVEAMIDEHYIDRVRADLHATCERQGQPYELRVRKVFPDVRDKNFKTEFVFVGEKPENIRTGQTYHVSLELGQPSEALLIPRGAFYGDTGGRWIFVITKDGKRAVRREVSIGRQNPEYYEVLSGLDPDEEVIVSSYRAFEQAVELIIK